MAQPHVYRTEAIVLRQRPLVDADKVCVLFTPFHGRIEAAAKGVRRSRSRLAGHLEPLTRSRLLIVKARSLDIITQAETLDAFPALHDDLDRLSRALYAAELVDRFTGSATDGGVLYRLLLDTLHRLETADSLDLPLRWFEMRLPRRPGLSPPAAALRPLRGPPAARGQRLLRARRRRPLPGLSQRRHRPPAFRSRLQVVTLPADRAVRRVGPGPHRRGPRARAPRAPAPARSSWPWIRRSGPPVSWRSSARPPARASQRASVPVGPDRGTKGDD